MEKSQDCLCLCADGFWTNWLTSLTLGHPDWWFLSSTKWQYVHRNFWLCYGSGDRSIAVQTVSNSLLSYQLFQQFCFLIIMYEHFHLLIETLLYFRSLMQGRYSIHAPLLVKTLLHHFVSQEKAPPGMYRSSGGGSIVIGLASMLILETYYY